MLDLLPRDLDNLKMLDCQSFLSPGIIYLSKNYDWVPDNFLYLLDWDLIESYWSEEPRNYRKIMDYVMDFFTNLKNKEVISG
jgi:hypothetical protein